MNKAIPMMDRTHADRKQILRPHHRDTLGKLSQTIDIE
jgi:hypothetical protein